MMNPTVICNLRKILELQYAHICLHPDDLRQLTNIPDLRKAFYPFGGKSNFWEKKGFFHGGKTTVWVSRLVEPGHIKIIDRIPKDNPQWVYDTGTTCKQWSKPFSFKEPNDVSIIQRMMRLKAFW